jgi:hypothetical protein
MHDDYLAHHGIKGMKWGVRRYRNYDGTLTSAGRAKIKKRHKLSKTTKRELAKTAAALGLYGASLYGMHKYGEKVKADTERIRRENAERARKADEDYAKYRRQNAENRRKAGDSSNRQRQAKQSTASTKSKDRAQKYEGQNIDYASARKRVAALRDEVAKAQRNGTVTAEMINDLQEAMAQEKAARKQVQHGIWFINTRDTSLMHSSFGGIRYHIRRY